ncbi:AlbA family DNA-binding domain-containing protein [Olsenella urininfantis]|uniref:AlbA family DNA-binding domain-containing protein n=1 Tax=Olsenella urininfantis TaxID=1871033 RepID=UPI000984A557
MYAPVSQSSIDDLCNAEESQYLDRKSSRLKPRELARHIGAFANASGGKLIIGVEDNGVITGFLREGARRVEEFEQAALVECNPAPVVQSTRIPVTNSIRLLPATGLPPSQPLWLWGTYPRS